MKRAKHILLAARGRLQAIFDRLTGEWRPLFEPRIAADQMATQMKAASIPTISFFFLLALSSAIATFGLLANSAPAIIGAMIIAPLMTPIMGLSYGIVQLSWSQIVRSAITVFLGVVVVLAISYLSARYIEIQVAGTQMLSRAFPSLLDLGVAMAAGAAGAYSLSRESIKNSVAGVAIAVALVPPLAVVGIGVALGRKATADVGLSFREVGLFAGGNDIAVGASVLFLTNLAAIVVVAGTVMAIQSYARWKRGVFGLVGVLAASIVLMQPLSEELHKLRIKSTALNLAKRLQVTHPHIFEDKMRLNTLSVRYQDDVLHVRAEGILPRDSLEGSQARLDLYRDLLEGEVGEPVIVEIEAFPIDIVPLRSAPDGDKDKDAPLSPTSGE